MFAFIITRANETPSCWRTNTHLDHLVTWCDKTRPTNSHSHPHHPVWLPSRHCEVPLFPGHHHHPGAQVGAKHQLHEHNRGCTSWRSSTRQSQQWCTSAPPSLSPSSIKIWYKRRLQRIILLPDPHIPLSTSAPHSGSEAAAEADFGYSGQCLWLHQVHWHILEASQRCLSALLRWEYAPSLFLMKAASSHTEQMSGRKSDAWAAPLTRSSFQ